jgi:hypothetical protein
MLDAISHKPKQAANLRKQPSQAMVMHKPRPQKRQNQKQKTPSMVLLYLSGLLEYVGLHVWAQWCQQQGPGTPITARLKRLQPHYGPVSRTAHQGPADSVTEHGWQKYVADFMLLVKNDHMQCLFRTQFIIMHHTVALRLHSSPGTCGQHRDNWSYSCVQNVIMSVIHNVTCYF